MGIARKSIHLKKDIQKGEVLSDSDITSLRPGDGISPMQWENIVGKIVNKDIKAFDKLNPEDII